MRVTSNTAAKHTLSAPARRSLLTTNCVPLCLVFPLHNLLVCKCTPPLPSTHFPLQPTLNSHPLQTALCPYPANTSPTNSLPFHPTSLSHSPPYLPPHTPTLSTHSTTNPTLPPPLPSSPPASHFLPYLLPPTHPLPDPPHTLPAPHSRVRRRG